MRKLGFSFFLFFAAVLCGGEERMELEPLVVTPPGMDLDLLAVDVASDVSVISRETIENSGAVSVPDLLRNEANVLIRSTSGNVNDGQVAMRGFGENSHLRTLILVDGHKLNRPDMGVASWDSLPVLNVERIAVIRGGQNVLYGDYALAGVISITTKRGAEAGTQARGVFGDFGYIGGYLGHGGAVGPLDYYVSVDRAESEGFRSNSLSRSTTVAGSLAWFAGDADTISLRVSQTDRFREYAGPLTYEQMRADPTRSTYTDDDYNDVLTHEASLLWKTSRQWGDARLAAGFNRRDMDWQLQGIYADNRQYGVSLGPRVRLGGDDRYVIAGVDASYDRLEFTNYDPRDTRYVGGEAELDRVSVQPYIYVHDRFSRDWIVGGGVRYEYAASDNRYADYVDDQILPYNETNRGTFPNRNYTSSPDLDPDTSFSGGIKKDGLAATLHLTREFGPGRSVWIRYDRCYRYPVLDEVAAYQGYALSDALNEGLDPEQGDHVAVGGRRQGDAWRVQWSAFALLMDNEIVFDEAARLNRNLGETRRLGADVEVALERDWYGANTRWSFQDARLAGGENRGNVVPLAPPFYGVCSVWVAPVERLRLTVSWLYTARQYQGNDVENGLRRMDAYGLLGLAVQVQLSERAQLNLNMDNLLDETYASTAYSSVYYPGAGRSFRCGLTFEF